LTDVASTDQHTVKPWFAGRLDFSPRVQDFAEEGFPLIGGRLDYLDGRSVAALIYRRNKHFINVFVWPAADDKQVTPLAREESRGYHVAHFVDDGLNYFAVSDVDPAELDRLMRLIEQPTTRPSAPEPH
jgi:anti-sigma factor RsiW